MKNLLEEIKGSRGHQVFLAVLVALMAVAAYAKYSPKPVNVRQAAIEQAVAGFNR